MVVLSAKKSGGLKRRNSTPKGPARLPTSTQQCAAAASLGRRTAATYFWPPSANPTAPVHQESIRPQVHGRYADRQPLLSAACVGSSSSRPLEAAETSSRSLLLRSP